ncbi:nuclear transport factor 2 family protein [Pseudomonas sp. C2B4]|uniref:nuclear transport factor 2 family protein n=1 Tax=Pseudomonas sp. C2B4 TaxID=2735270 RepID=UPI0015861638|nr:nuclear transport factor 2 family protein [Pseudomonas sp. C2B4]NUU34584.1 nuclear transport factor 2 family protein [Pseudomonas sp. C2B4]
MSINHPNVKILRAIYKDLSCIDIYVDDDVVLHTADREIPGHVAKIIGKNAVLAKELELIELTQNTLVMDVQSIIANDHFGAVLGVLRMFIKGSHHEMPFCGLWRFRNGRIVEHWENAYDPTVLGNFF